MKIIVIILLALSSELLIFKGRYLEINLKTSFFFLTLSPKLLIFRRIWLYLELTLKKLIFALKFVFSLSPKLSIFRWKRRYVEITFKKNIFDQKFVSWIYLLNYTYFGQKDGILKKISFIHTFVFRLYLLKHWQNYNSVRSFKWLYLLNY